MKKLLDDILRSGKRSPFLITYCDFYPWNIIIIRSVYGIYFALSFPPPGGGGGAE